MPKVGIPGLDAAVAYAKKHALHALLVWARDELLLESYENGQNASSAHPLYSGTKSFWGTAALRAIEDGIFDLDEPVVRLIPEFKGDIRRAITPRMLLTMTAGYGFGGLGTAVPAYDTALEIQLKNRPGETFTYGGIPLQVFGAVLARKLAASGRNPHGFLRARVLEPAGVHVASWRTLKDGTQPLPTGAFLTAPEWLRFGVFVRDRYALLAPLFEGSQANPRYGLTWWRSPLDAHPGVVYASGSGGQALYVIPSAGAVVAKFGASSSYRHETFLTRLLS